MKMRGMSGYQMKAAEVKASCGHVVKLYDLRHNSYRGWAPTAQRQMAQVAATPCKTCQAQA